MRRNLQEHHRTRSRPEHGEKSQHPNSQVPTEREERPSCAILRSAGARTSDIHGSYPTRSLAQTENSWGKKPKLCLVRARKLILSVRPRLPWGSHGEDLMRTEEEQPVHRLLFCRFAARIASVDQARNRLVSSCYSILPAGISPCMRRLL